MLLDFVICNLRETKFNEQFAFISLEMLKNCDNHFPDDLFELVKTSIEEEVVKYPVITPRLRLAVETIEVCSSKLNGCDKSKLLPILYFILKVEPRNVFLCNISRNLGYQSENEMIGENLPYFSEKFHEELNINCLTSSSLVLFRNLIQGSKESAGKQMFEVFEKSVETILQILDLNYNKSPDILLQLLLSITDPVSKIFPSGNKEHPVKRKEESFCFRKSWSQYLQMMTILDSTNNPGEGDDGGGRDEGNGNDHTSDSEREDLSLEKSDVSVHVKIIKEILERSANLLSLPEEDHRLLVIEIISHCVRGLAQQENDLLPLVHKMWPSLVSRLSDDVAVANCAFQVILDLSVVCGDFVYRRVNSDIFPKILPFLRSHVSDGIKSRTRHPFTLIYRLQLTALTAIGVLAVGINAQGRSLWTMIYALLPYLNRNQPPALIEATRESLLRLKSLDPDAVWFCSEAYLKGSDVTIDEKLLNDILMNAL